MPSSIHCYACDEDFISSEYVTHRITCSHCETSYCRAEYGDEFCPDCGIAYGSYQGDGCSCPDCRERAQENGELPYDGVFAYNYTPNLVFHGDGDYHLGIELEIRASDSALPIYDWARDNGVEGLFYVKEDSSVEGFEIVTHPMTPSYFESVDWDRFFAMLNVVYPLGSGRNGNQRRREPDGHGLHVHVSRTAFSGMTALARWSYLLNRPGRAHMERIARRVSHQWAAFSDTPVLDVMTCHQSGPTYWRWEGSSSRRHNYRYEDVLCTCGCGAVYQNTFFLQPEPLPAAHRVRFQSMPRRYNAVNLQNPNTVEVRIFRSTRSPDEFRDSVRTLYAAVEYVRTMQPHHMATRATSAVLSWEGFAEYVQSEYAALYPTVAGMDVHNQSGVPSMMSEALAADTAITEGEYEFTSDIPRPPNDLDFVPYPGLAADNRCDVDGCVVRHRATTPVESRAHRDRYHGPIVPAPAPAWSWASIQDVSLNSSF